MNLSNLPLLDQMVLRQERAWAGVTAPSGPLSRRARRAASKARAAFADASVQAVVSAGDTSRGRSPQIWSRIPVMNLIQDPSQGFFVGDDFIGWNGTVASNVGTYSGPAGGYKSYEVTSGSIKQINTMGPTTVNGPAGVIALTTVSGANKNVALELGGGNGGSFEIVNGAPPSRLAFECRFQIDRVTGNDIFVGLAEKGLAVVSGAGSLLTTADALSQDTFIGGYWLTAAAGTLVANAGSNGAAPLTSPGSQAITASTWYKFGFLYDSTQPGTNNLLFYANGVLLGGLSSATTNFPTGKVLTPLFCMQNDATGTNANNLYLDWWYGAQIFQG